MSLQMIELADKNDKTVIAGAQGVQHLPSKHKALSSNPSTEKTNCYGKYTPSEQEEER
jgi:hypothetical protein